MSDENDENTGDLTPEEISSPWQSTLEHLHWRRANRKRLRMAKRARKRAAERTAEETEEAQKIRQELERAGLIRKGHC